MNIFKRYLIALKRSKWTFIFVSLVLLIITLFLNEDLNFEAFVASLVGAFTGYLGILRQTIDDDKVFRELFITFNSRYSDETNDLLNSLRIENGKLLEDSDKLLIIDYFNLCSEEYLWFLKGRIPFNVWKAWEAGIVVNLSISSVKELFLNETLLKEQKTSYYGFAEYITAILNNQV
jgi:hypothetical protein